MDRREVREVSGPRPKWLLGLQSSSLFRPPPRNAHDRQVEILGYVELLVQFASESFVDEVNELVRCHYPKEEACLVDDVLAAFVLHHPEHAHAVLHALLSCVIDGTLPYSKGGSPFRCFVALFGSGNEKDFSEQWAVACGETLRLLTHYNRPVYKSDIAPTRSGEGTSSDPPPAVVGEGTSRGNDERLSGLEEKRVPSRLLTPWITDSLLAAPLGVRCDYFRWCGGVMGKYAAGVDLKPPSTVGQLGHGKQPQLLPSTPRWAVANGAAVILSVCDDEVERYRSAHLTAAAVPALLLPPEPPALDNHLVAGLPPLEPYAQLFHRYYAIATPEAAQRLLLGLLEAPSSWAPDALDAAVQLVVLLRSAEDLSSTFQLPQTWLHLHFLRPIGSAIARQSGVAADAAAALLLRIFSQPVLLFPPRGHAQGVRVIPHHFELPGYSACRDEIEMAAVRANEEATSCALVALMTEHGSEVERRVCSLWELSLGLQPVDMSVVKAPQLDMATPLQPAVLSWNLFHPLLRVMEHLQQGTRSQACLRRLFLATVEAVVQRAFPFEENKEQKSGNLRGFQAGGGGAGAKSVGMAELRAMVHCLFTEVCPSPHVAAYLLADALLLCLSHDVRWRKEIQSNEGPISQAETLGGNQKKRAFRPESADDRGVIATFDSYLVAAMCALACEVQMISFSRAASSLPPSAVPGGEQVGSGSYPVLSSGTPVDVQQAKRVLELLERLLTEVPSFADQGVGSSCSDIVGAGIVAAHISGVLGKSKACVQALAAVGRCKWDSEICRKASHALELVQGCVQSMVEVTSSTPTCKAEPVETSIEPPKPNVNASVSGQAFGQAQALLYRMPHQNRMPSGSGRNTLGKGVGGLSSRLGALRSQTSMQKRAKNTDDHWSSGPVRVLLTEQVELVISSVPVIWRRLLLAPDSTNIKDGASPKQGWRQVVEALCKLVETLPGKATSAILLQVQRDLSSWAGQSDMRVENMRKVNRRIVTILVELLRLKQCPNAISGAAKSSDLLLRATDGLDLEEDIYVLPQLELLEAASSAVQKSLSWDSSGGLDAQKLVAFLKDRIPGAVRCLSHCCVDARVLSQAFLRDLRVADSVRLGFPGSGECGSMRDTIDSGKRAVEEALAMEAQRRRAAGSSLSLLAAAATALGHTIPNLED